MPYIIKCASRDEGCSDREVTELHCTYDPQTKSGGPDARRKVWPRSIGSQQPMRWKRKFALYNPLLKEDLPSSVPHDQDWTAYLNPQSLECLTGCLVEPSLKSAGPVQISIRAIGLF